MDEGTRDGIETALNEADVLGIQLDPAGASCDVLVHVLALPESGPLDRDARRALRLAGPGQVSILLRADQDGEAGYGPVIPPPSWRPYVHSPGPSGGSWPQGPAGG